MRNDICLVICTGISDVWGMTCPKMNSLDDENAQGTWREHYAKLDQPWFHEKLSKTSWSLFYVSDLNDQLTTGTFRHPICQNEDRCFFFSVILYRTYEQECEITCLVHYHIIYMSVSMRWVLSRKPVRYLISHVLEDNSCKVQIESLYDSGILWSRGSYIILDVKMKTVALVILEREDIEDGITCLDRHWHEKSKSLLRTANSC